MAKKFQFDGLLKEAEKQKAEAEKHIALEETQKGKSDSFIKENIIIKEEFKYLIPPLAEDEYAKLEDNILAEGCRDALIIWQKGEEYILIDGHNRFNICKTHGLDFKIQILSFENEEQVNDWMVNNQLGKRNVTEETKSYLRGLQYSREKKKVANIENLKQFPEEDKLSLSGNTAERLAQQHRVSDKTIKRDEKYAIAIDKIAGENKNLKWNILNKKINLPKGSVMKLAEEKTETTQKIGDFLYEGLSFTQAVQKVKPKSEIINEAQNPKTEQLRRLKNDMILCLEEAIKQNDMDSIEELEEILKEFKKILTDTK